MNVPKLRFKEFEDEWKDTNLGTLLAFNNGINADKDSYGHGRKFINVLDILNNNSIEYNDIIGSVSVTPKVEEANKVEYGDLLFLRSSETREDVGKSSVYLDRNEFALFGGFVIRGKKQANYHPYFLKLNLEFPKVRNQIGTRAGGSTRFNVSQSILSSVEVKIPSKDEQSKIAKFIATLDLKIQKQQERINLFKVQKKGYMQKIFKQEIRFKNENGGEYPKWKTKVKAAELFEAISNKNPEEKLPVLSATQNQGMVLRDLLNKDMQYSTTNLNSYKIVDIDDFVISLRSFQGGIELSHLRGLVSPAYTIFRKKNNDVCINYFKYLFKTETFINQLKTATYGIRDGKSISYKDFSTLKFDLPSYAEQRKIAGFLSKLDEKIQIEKQKLDSLQEQKKGFMQQMFI
ncbi:restriction endonuclease subunit S [Bacillus cereus]|uniref:restriction endonuclease subunit S n=1 Tax=Bacillus cereus TaxID=1396 RepID=UPI003A8081FC